MEIADKQSEMQVIGCLMKNPFLLAEIDKYHFDVRDFSSKLTRYVFSAINNLFLDGAKQIGVIDLENYLSVYIDLKKDFDNFNGIAYLQDCEALSNEENFDYYYNRLKKFSALRSLNNDGFDISSFYVDNPTDKNYFQVMEKFDEIKVSDIFDEIKKKLFSLADNYTIGDNGECGPAAEGLKELKNQLKKAPELGSPLQGKYFNTVVRGARKGKYYIRSAGSGLGKAIPNTTLIPTPLGPRTVEEIMPGDYIFGADGKPTKVLQIHPQSDKKEIIKITFASGRIANCCEEHLWNIHKSTWRDKNKFETIATKNLLNQTLKNQKGNYYYSVPISAPLEYSEKKYSISPYVMGLLLGDGSFRYNNSQKALHFSSKDEELVAAVAEELNCNYKKNSEKNYSWTFKFKNSFAKRKNLWVEEALSDFPELWNKKSEDKFIPQEYLYGSVEQRTELLSGLLDTDGHIDEKGRISYSTISEKLKNQIIVLCESLGFVAKVIVDKRKDKYTTEKCYIISILCPKNKKRELFKLNRKKEIAENYSCSGKKELRRDIDTIVKIEKTGIYVSMTCFTVDSKDSLFLMNNCIVTHNTRMAVGDACNLAFPVYYDWNSNCWCRKEHCEKVLFITTELDKEEIQTLILSWVSGVNEEKILLGTYTFSEEAIVDKAIELINEYSENFIVEQISDPSIAKIESTIRKQVLIGNIQNVFYDYIFSSPGLLGEFASLKLREDSVLMMLSTALKDLAVELKIFLATATQITGDPSEEKGIRGVKYIRGM